MGSFFEYVPIDKAMEALNVSRRTVYRYIRDGRLRTEKDGARTLVSRKDLKAMLDLRSRKKGLVVTKKTVAQLEARVHVLELEMSVVKRLLDLRNDPLELTAPELLSLYRMAEYHLTIAWSPHQEDMWAEIFARMSLEDLEKMSEAVENPDPWRPFYQLCKAMFDNPHNAELKLKLNAGKNNLEKLAYVWAKRGEKTAKALDKMIKRDDILGRKLMRKVSRKRPKN